MMRFEKSKYVLSYLAGQHGEVAGFISTLVGIDSWQKEETRYQGKE